MNQSPQHTQTNQLLTEHETARLLNLTTRCLQAWRLRGTGLPFIRISSRCIRYRMSDIQQWIDSNTKTSTSEV